jgi:hypothetical protein
MGPVSVDLASRKAYGGLGSLEHGPLHRRFSLWQRRVRLRLAELVQKTAIDTCAVNPRLVAAAAVSSSEGGKQSFPQSSWLILDIVGASAEVAKIKNAPSCDVCHRFVAERNRSVNHATG